MSFKQNQKFYQGAVQPINPNPGDEWFNITTNRNYQFLSLSGNSPTWVETAVAPVANVFSLANLVVTGSSTLTGTSTSPALNATNIAETVSLLTTPLNSIYRYNVTSQTVAYCTATSNANFIVNITASDTTTLNSMMSIGQSISCVLMVTNGASAYYNTGLQIDGASTAVKWQSGAAPSSGNASAVDIYSYTIIKTANATFSAFASQTKFS